MTVVDIRGKSIKLGFTFPAEATVLRREIHERIQEENRVAAAGGEAIAKAFEQSTAQVTGATGTSSATEPAEKPEPKRKVG